MLNPAPTILAIETATSSCSVALSYDGQVYAREQLGNNIHSQVLLTMVQEVLAEASLLIVDIDAFAVGQGPGSFTGLRIGVGVAQGLAYGVGRPMVGVSSLDALAHQANVDGHVIAAIDARMGEIYCCEYNNRAGNIERLKPLDVVKPELLDTSLQSSPELFLVGNAWSEYWPKFSTQLRENAVHLDQIVYPNAKSILHLAESKYQLNEVVCATDFMPEYVRNDVAKKAAKKSS